MVLSNIKFVKYVAVRAGINTGDIMGFVNDILHGKKKRITKRQFVEASNLQMGIPIMEMPKKKHKHNWIWVGTTYSGKMRQYECKCGARITKHKYK